MRDTCKCCLSLANPHLAPRGVVPVDLRLVAVPDDELVAAPRVQHPLLQVLLRIESRSTLSKRHKSNKNTLSAVQNDKQETAHSGPACERLTRRQTCSCPERRASFFMQDTTSTAPEKTDTALASQSTHVNAVVAVHKR